MGLTDMIAGGMDASEATGMLLNIVWTMLGAILVYFMQAGFAMVETGFTRAKNAGNIIMKNMMDFVIGSIAFYFLGYGFMFGANQLGLIGGSGFFNPFSLANADGTYGVTGLPIGVYMIFQTVFCATSATIVSGAMAERTKFSAYLVYSACISILIYPVTGHWIWGGGWLADMRFHDFAGSTAVHMVGGICALVGAKILGPRIGKYNADGTPNAFPGHNIPIGALGVFILWFCWFGFNCGSTIAATTNLGDIAMTTNLAAAAATLIGLFTTWIKYGKPDISMTLNCSLAGLVAITAGCDVVSNTSALIIGALSGFLTVIMIEFIDRKVKVDDPVGAIGVHGFNGAFGTIMTGVFCKSSVLADMGMSRIELVGIEALGVASVIAYVAIMAFIVFTVINKTIGLRVSAEEEIDGLDVHEHGVPAYPNFNLHRDR